MENTSTTPTPDRSLIQPYPPAFHQVIKHSRGEWSPSSPEPSFPEFLSWLLEEPVDRWDEHWLPVSLRCRSDNLTLHTYLLYLRVCQLPFRYILRYEELEEEWAHLLDRYLPPPLHLLAPLPHGLFQPGGDKLAEGGSSVAMGQQVTLEHKLRFKIK